MTKIKTLFALMGLAATVLFFWGIVIIGVVVCGVCYGLALLAVSKKKVHHEPSYNR
jgi:hypothetical protein